MFLYVLEIAVSVSHGDFIVNRSKPPLFFLPNRLYSYNLISIQIHNLLQTRSFFSLSYNIHIRNQIQAEQKKEE